MPKQLYSYNPFGGGLNTKDDPRDIQKNELVDCNNIMVDSIGRVRTVGGDSALIAAYDGVPPPVPGYGLFSFSADANFAGSDTVSTGRDFLAFVNEDTMQVYIYPNASNTWQTPTFDLGAVAGSGDNSGKVIFYYADNALRVLNANYEINTSLAAKWYGFIKKDYWYINGSYRHSPSAWYVKDNTIAYPTRGLVSPHIVIESAHTDSTTTDLRFDNTEDGSNGTSLSTEVSDANTSSEWYLAYSDSTDNRHNVTAVDADSFTTTTAAAVWDNENVRIYTAAGKGFCVDVKRTTSTQGIWERGNYYFYQSFVYLGNQESRLTRLAGDSIPIDDINQYFKVTATARRDYDERIIGGRIYVRRSGKGEPYRLLLDLSFEEGSRMSTSHDFNQWNTSSAILHTEVYSNTYSIKVPNPETFNVINGYDPAQPSNSIGSTGWGAKCAVVANARTFLGAVRIKDSGAKVNTFRSRVLYSPINQYDVFPTNHYLDVGTGDGDSIVALQEISDRLLVFKEKKMYVINIGSGSDSGWFVEGEYPYKGVSSPAATFKSDLGVVWANGNGCYAFDGKQVSDLTQKLSDGDWKSHAEGTNIGVGYIPEKNQVVVVKDLTMDDAADQNAYLYDFRTQSWTKTDSNGGIFSTGDYKSVSNFVIYNNILTWAAGTTSSFFKVDKWDDDSAEVTATIVTKDEDFGDPSIKKKFYKVYVNYKNNSSGAKDATLYYKVNGRGDWATFGSNSGVFSMLASSNVGWHMATWAQSGITGQSISYKLSTASSTNFELNELTIEWRPLRARAAAA